MDVSAPLQRIAWAEKLRVKLKQLIEEWGNLNPWSVDARIAEDRLSYTVGLAVTTPPALDDWGYLFGDAIHNLRAALDNAVVAVARQCGIGDAKILRRLQFPICSNAKEWADSSSRIKELPQVVQDVILKVQPFTFGENGQAKPDDPLLILRDTSNENKHRVEATASLQQAALNYGGMVEFETEEGALLSVPPDITVCRPTLPEGGILMVQRTKGRIVKVKGKYNILAQIHVRLPTGESVDVSAILLRLHQQVGHVLQEMAKIASC
jgi:hypothetical protein